MSRSLRLLLTDLERPKKKKSAAGKALTELEAMSVNESLAKVQATARTEIEDDHTVASSQDGGAAAESVAPMPATELEPSPAHDATVDSVASAVVAEVETEIVFASSFFKKSAREFSTCCANGSPDRSL